MLCAMLNYAKLEAYHTFIGTTDLPYRFDEEPVMGVANHMITAVWLNNQWYFLDGTADFLSYRYPSDFIQGKQALIAISADSFQIAIVPVISVEINNITDTILCRVSGDTLSGKGFKAMDGLGRCRFVSYYNGEDATDQKIMLEKYLELGQNNCLITDIKLEGNTDRDSVLKMRYDFKIPKYTNLNENKIYVNLNIDRTWDESEIELETRTREFIFDQTSSVTRCVKFEIPENYSVDILPKEFVSNSEKFGFNFSYSKEGNTIYYQQKYWFTVLEINKNDFEEWNAVIEKLNKAYSQVLVLTHL